MLCILFTVYLWSNICTSAKTLENDGLDTPANFNDILAKNGLTQPVKVTNLRNNVYEGRDLEIDYMLFNRNNPNGTPVSTDVSVEEFKNYINLGEPFKIITHGWLSSGSSSTVENMKTAYLKGIDNINVITVNWEIVAGRTDYRVAATDTHNVGKELAKLILFLDENKLLVIDQLHLIGHSLGAHVSGTAGHYIKEAGKKVKRITGLDPAGPGFEFFNSFLTDANTMALNKEDAEFVDVIHTSSGTLGFSDAIGHSDFYPNGGTHAMPGCGYQALTCSHSRAHMYFAESILYDKNDSNAGFWANKCETYAEYTKGGCNSTEENLMGEFTDTSKTGIYYLSTNAEPPYALNHNRLDDPSWFSYSPLNSLSPF